MNVDKFVSCYYSGLVLSVIIQNRMFDSLFEGIEAERLNEYLGTDTHDSALLMEYVSRTTSFIKKEGNKFFWDDYFADDKQGQFRLLKYMGAYGLDVNLDKYSIKGVNKYLLQEAFSKIEERFPIELIKKIKKYDSSIVFELGCGLAPFSRAMISAGMTKISYAVDSNEFMIKRVRELAKAIIIEKKLIPVVDSLQGFIENKDEFPEATMVLMSNVLNSFFEGDSKTNISEVLKRVKLKFPNAKLVNIEYLGELGKKYESGIKHGAETLNQDFSQIISGQGVPATSIDFWDDTYQVAGIKLDARYSIESLKGVRQFIDVLS